MNLIIKRFDRAPLEDRLLRANPAQPPKSKSGPGPAVRRDGPPAPYARSAAPPATASVAAPVAAAVGALDRNRRGGKKHARKSQTPQTLFAEELAKAL